MPLLPAFEGAVDDPAAAVLRVQLHWEYATICRGENSIYRQLSNDPNIKNPFDYIQFYGLRTHDTINGKPVSEIVYVHSKLMIVDDETVIMGSANINDRSMLGKCDSEIAVVVTDEDKVPIQMAGREVMVSRFAHELRMSIFQEHSGSEPMQLVDPFGAAFRQIWNEVARINTEMYRIVFRCYPDDNITTIKARKEFEAQADEGQYQQLCDVVKGFLVQFPLEFLRDEDLRINIFKKEFLIPTESFV